MKRSPFADSSIRRPASAPASISTSAASGFKRSNCVPKGRGTTGIKCVWHRTGRQVFGNRSPPVTCALEHLEHCRADHGSVHGCGGIPSAENTCKAPGRRSPRSYQGLALRLSRRSRQPEVCRLRHDRFAVVVEVRPEDQIVVAVARHNHAGVSLLISRKFLHALILDDGSPFDHRTGAHQRHRRAPNRAGVGDRCRCACRRDSRHERRVDAMGGWCRGRVHRDDLPRPVLDRPGGPNRARQLRSRGCRARLAMGLVVPRSSCWRFPGRHGSGSTRPATPPSIAVRPAKRKAGQDATP